jgi:hypothetical protein
MVPQLKRKLSEDQLKVLVSMPPQVGGIFPNVLFAFGTSPSPTVQCLA